MPIPVGTKAPSFRLPARDGAPRSLDDIGTPAVLAFFKTSCPTCKLAFPVFGELERRFRGAADVVAVSQDPMLQATQWLGELGFDGDVVNDSYGRYEVSRAYDVQTVPTLVLVGPTGEVDGVAEGWSRDGVNEVARRLGELTGRGGEPVSTPDDGLPPHKPG
jgi:peroxiredoxin